MQKTVLITSSSLLLSAAVENLLMSESDLNVIGIEAENETDLLGVIERYHPDVVFLGACLLNQHENMLAQLLFSNSNLTVIVTGPEGNLVHLFHKKEILITRAADLTDVIRSY